MLAAQIRFQQYGLLSLVLLPLMTLQSVAGRPRDAVYAGLLMAGAYLASPGLFSYQYPVGGSLRYAHGYQLIELLGTACADRPGLLLADHNWGNFLRYRTRCPLLANNFIMTPEDLAAMEESRRLLSLEPAALSAENPDLRYVLVSAMDQHHLGTRLLSGESFEGFRLIGEIHGMGGRAIGRAYEVLPGLAPGHAGDTPGK